LNIDNYLRAFMINNNKPLNKYEEGQVLLVNKELGWTSFDAVRKLRNTMRIKKVGHAGTLDPLASGLLIICTGKFTKRINEFMAQEKEYTGTITLGAVTPTYDLESDPQQVQDIGHLTQEQVLAATGAFTGTIQQLPPAHSAIKKDGKRLYELARAGKEVQLKPRTVTIKAFEITRIELPEVDFREVCSTGTYIRSLAHDFGAALGVGGYLSALCRTRIGSFTLDTAKTVGEWEEEIREEKRMREREELNGE